MNPLDARPMMGPPPQAEVQSDGTFVISSVMPGRWRLNVSGAPGYLKSVRQGDQEVSPWDFEIGSSAVQLKIVVGTKFAQLQATLSTAATGVEPAFAMLWVANGDPQYQQNFPVNPQGSSGMSVPPGKYYVCAFQAAAPPWFLMQNGAMRKALQSHCETVEAPEAGSVRVQLEVIPATDLKQMLEKIEE